MNRIYQVVKSPKGQQTMLTIRKEQFQAFATNEMEKFILDTTAWIKENEPNWFSDNKQKIEIQKFIKELIIFAKKCNVHKEINIQRLVYYKIKYNYDLPLSKGLNDTLTEENLEEEKRVQNFFLSLTDGQELIEITLDTNLGMV